MAAALVSVGFMHQTDIRSRFQDAIVYRDGTKQIRKILLNAQRLFEGDVDALAMTTPRKITYHVVRSPLEADEWEVPQKDIDSSAFHILGVMEEHTGNVLTLMNGETKDVLSWSAADFDWPAVVTVMTHKQRLLAVDDLPGQGVQPVLLMDTEWHNDEPHTPAVAQAMKACTRNQLLVVAVDDGDHLKVVDVMVPRYDAQLPEAGEMTHISGQHQSVPFIHQRARMISEDGTNLVGGVGIDERLGGRPPTRLESVFASSVNTIFFDPTSKVVRNWHQAGLALQRRAQAEQLATGLTVSHGNNQLFLGQVTRSYPQPNEGRNVTSWLWTDVGVDRPEVHASILEAASNKPPGTISAFENNSTASIYDDIADLGMRITKNFLSC